MTNKRLDSDQIMRIRREYNKSGLLEEDVLPNPYDQFDKWFKVAVDENFTDPNAMTLTTVGADLKPSARIVLLKDYDETGFVFYTNYDSRKGQQIKENPNVAAVFYWSELERQVRIEGHVEKVSKTESEAYFHSRPFDSQIGALASHQSHEVESREVLEERFEKLCKEYENATVPLPSYWGGYRILPERIEFWQGRPGRLHDRILYQKENKNWRLVRLSP